MLARKREELISMSVMSLLFMLVSIVRMRNIQLLNMNSSRLFRFDLLYFSVVYSSLSLSFTTTSNGIFFNDHLEKANGRKISRRLDSIDFRENRINTLLFSHSIIQSLSNDDGNTLFNQHIFQVLSLSLCLSLFLNY